MHVKRADILALKVNLQSFVTCVGKFHSVRLRDERNAREKRLIYKEKFFATENGMAKIKGKKDGFIVSIRPGALSASAIFH
jgi:hypothetical protein